MGDISTWSPTDNSNTTAPPDGWPEGMAPSAVNNSARAMMGAVRRWYDQVISGSLVLPYLPIGGGTLTGTVSAPQYNVSGNILAARTGDASNLIYDGGGQIALQMYAGQTFYKANSHSFQNDAGANSFGIDASGNVGTTGTVSAGNITSTGDVHANNGVTCFTVTATGTIQGAQLTSTGAINAAGTVTGTSFIGNVSVPANGPVTTGGTVTGGTITSTGNISATSGTVSAANVTASSNITAAGSVTGGSMHCQGTMQVDGQSNLLGPLYVGPGGAWARIDSSGTYNVSGSWTAISGREAKENITPYESAGLAAVLALRPVQFNYRPELFGAAEAEKVRYGLVADEVAEVLPEMVGEAVFGDQVISTLNTGHISVVLLNACRELAEQNAVLAARLSLLEAEFGAASR